MKITLEYTKEEVEAMAEANKAVASELGIDTSDQEEVLRMHFRAVSHYIDEEFIPRQNGSCLIVMDAKEDFILDVCGTIRTSAPKVAQVAQAVKSVVGAVKALVPCINDLKTILVKTMDLKVVDTAEERIGA